MVKLLPRPRHVATALVAFAVGGRRRAGGDADPHLRRAAPRCLELMDDVVARRRGEDLALPLPGGRRRRAHPRDRRQRRGAGLRRAGPHRRAGPRGRVRRGGRRPERGAAARRVGDAPLPLAEPQAAPPAQALRGHRRPALEDPGDGGAGEGDRERRGLAVATYGHAGDGNLHCNVLFDRAGRAAEGRTRRWRRSSARRSTSAAPSPASTASGSRKRDFLEYEQGAEVLALERRLKALFDPLGILNPGKIFPSAERDAEPRPRAGGA